MIELMPETAIESEADKRFVCGQITDYAREGKAIEVQAIFRGIVLYSWRVTDKAESKEACHDIGHLFKEGRRITVRILEREGKDEMVD